MSIKTELIGRAYLEALVTLTRKLDLDLHDDDVLIGVSSAVLSFYVSLVLKEAGSPTMNRALFDSLQVQTKMFLEGLDHVN